MTASRPRLADYLGNLSVLVLAVVSHIPLFKGQFDGEDEALQLHAVNRLLHALQDWRMPASLVEFVGTLSIDRHPPLRHLLSLPGAALFPGTEFGLRLGAIALSIGMTWLAMSWGEALRGRRGRWVAGLFVATSGVYNWTSMAFGWSVIGACLLAISIQLRHASYDLDDPLERRSFHRASVLCVLMFLTNTGCILMTVGLGLLYLCHNSLITVARVSLRYVAFYAAYYLYFLVIAPEIYQRLTGRPVLVGQLAQNLGRIGRTGLSTDSLSQNFAGLNAYLLPFVGWILLGIGAHTLWRTQRGLLLVVAPYLIAWTFLLRDESQQYFLLATLPITICGAVTLFAHSGTSRTIRLLATLGLVTVLGSQAAWNWHVFIHSYTETTYPRTSLERAHARADRIHNIAHPYRELARDLERVVQPHERVASELGGSFFMFYYKDDPGRLYHSRYLGHLSDADFRQRADCYVLHRPLDPLVRAILSRRELCADQYRTRLQYPGSYIKLYVLDPSSTL